MVRNAKASLTATGSEAKLMVIIDGAYAVRNLGKPLSDDGLTVVSRLRRDAKLFDLPGPAT